MKNDTEIISLRQPESVDDPLTEIARDGARRMLAAAIRAEADAFVDQYSEETLPDGHGAPGASMPCCRPLPARYLDRGFPGGPGRTPRPGCANLSPGVVSRLTGEWQQEYDRWQRRDLAARRYLFLGNRTQQYVQIGNAVPPFLARQIAKLLLSALIP